MKFVVVVCLLALAAAEEEKPQENKSQAADTTTPSNSGLTQQTGSLLNNQVFPPFTSPVSSLSYTGFSPIQPVNSEFFSTTGAATPGIVNSGISSFPVTRTVLPGSSIVSGIQSAFPNAGGIIPNVISGIGSQYPGLGGILSSGIPQIANQALDSNAANAAIQSVSNPSYRFLTPQGLSTIPTQGLQSGQTVGLSGIPAFTSGILSPITNGVYQGQIPSAILKNPSGGSAATFPNVPGLTTGGNISTGSLTNAFRHT